MGYLFKNMKYLTILSLLLSGCATGISEYNQGCRDAIENLTIDVSGYNFHPTAVDDKGNSPYCDNLDQKRNFEFKERSGQNRPN